MKCYELFTKIVADESHYLLMLTPDILACRALFLVDMSIGLAFPSTTFGLEIIEMLVLARAKPRSKREVKRVEK